MDSIDEIVDSYRTYLEMKHADLHSKYVKRKKGDPESARAEAVLFALLRQLTDSTTVHEDPSTGGPDFLCKKDHGSFLLEVTSVKTTTVEQASGLRNAPSPGATSFSLITHVLRNTTSNKASQLSGFQVPRILSVTTEHIDGSVLLGPDAAKTLLTGDTQLTFSIDSPERSTEVVTHLNDSVFFRFRKDGSVEPCRQSISAILLVHILQGSCEIVGILHPAPAIPFDIELLSEIPFLRIANWPFRGTAINMEWAISAPKAAKFHFSRVEFRKEELTSF
jgi:hypothetical protein